MKGVRTEVRNFEFRVQSPYDEDFIQEARNLSGKWEKDTKTWVFPLVYKDRVKKVLKDVYGYIPAEDLMFEDILTVRVHIGKDQYCRLSTGPDRLKMFGRTLVRRYRRDVPPKLGEKVAHIKGRFARKGGSRRNPAIEASADAILEVRDVPRSVYESELEEYGDILEIVRVNFAQPPSNDLKYNDLKYEDRENLNQEILGVLTAAKTVGMRKEEIEGLLVSVYPY